MPSLTGEFERPLRIGASLVLEAERRPHERPRGERVRLHRPLPGLLRELEPFAGHSGRLLPAARQVLGLRELREHHRRRARVPPGDRVVEAVSNELARRRTVGPKRMDGEVERRTGEDSPLRGRLGDLHRAAQRRTGVRTADEAFEQPLDAERFDLDPLVPGIRCELGAEGRETNRLFEVLAKEEERGGETLGRLRAHQAARIRLVECTPGERSGERLVSLVAVQPREGGEGLGTLVAGGRHGERVLEQHHRSLRIPRVERVERRRDAPAVDRGVVGVAGQVKRSLAELGRG